MFMIMLVLDDNAKLDPVLEAWAKLGVSGVTILESSGLHRKRRKHIPMRYLYGDKSLEECGNSTLFVLVKQEALIQQCLAAAEKVIGSLDEPNTGVFAAWPLTFSKGIPLG